MNDIIGEAKVRVRAPQALMFGVFFFGMLTMHLFNQTHELLMRIQSQASVKNVVGTTKADTMDDGWHAINVFYGERSGLGAPETQESFSQCRQDQIILDLLGPNGYFIDLAANDAKVLSNTLLLERHGWNGLCVEPNPA